MKKQPGAPFSVIQDIFKLPYPPIRVTPYHEYDLTREIVSQFLNSTKDDDAIGLAPAYDADNILSSLAFASSERVLLVYLAHKPPVIKGRYRSGRDLLHDMILRSDRRPKYAFKMDNVATALCLDLGFRIARAIDILSASQDFRHSMAGLKSVLGGEAGLNKANLAALFKHNENICAPAVQIALQAWTAWRAGTLPAMTQRLARIPRIDTRAFPEPQLYALSKLAWVARRLEDIKPTRVENEVDSEFSYQGGKLSVTSTRFRTRVLASHNQRIEVESTVGGKVSKFSGKTIFVDGRAARIALTAALGDTIRVTTVGREGPNRAEVQREDIVRNVLQHKSALLKQPFFTALWVARDEPDWTKTPRTEHEVELYFPHAALNPSQRAAVRAILSNEDIDRITLVQGPPGTGKTTVIAAAVVSIVSCAHDIERTVWVVAQSNVAVKNIAEKLAGVDCEFTLVVSKDFHYSWHEHLYEKIVDKVLRSDDLTDDFEALEERMLNSRVVLCTLSMLSNPGLSAITRLVPLQTLMVDEASQVEIGGFLPLLSHFSTTLRKMVLIGDDKQLPPFGQNKIQSLQSVFEMEHLRQEAIFLDTQYRMPEQLGSFIGKHVYDGKLQTVHRNASQCCWFVDVNGMEVAKGRSWINVAEAKAAIREAREYYQNGKSYRIITPYDAQRALLEKTLKEAKIPWENKVFCVDSFQGNEEDYIVLSIVRTEKIGFMAEVRRVNVMLSRCKKGMVICAKRKFVEGEAKNSLVGLLAAGLAEKAWD